MLIYGVYYTPGPEENRERCSAWWFIMSYSPHRSGHGQDEGDRRAGGGAAQPVLRPRLVDPGDDLHQSRGLDSTAQHRYIPLCSVLFFVTRSERYVYGLCVVVSPLKVRQTQMNTGLHVWSANKHAL